MATRSKTKDAKQTQDLGTQDSGVADDEQSSQTALFDPHISPATPISTDKLPNDITVLMQYMAQQNIAAQQRDEKRKDEPDKREEARQKERDKERAEQTKREEA